MAQAIITAEPVDIIDAEGLDSAVRYTLQPESPHLDVVHLDDGDDMPADDGIGIKLGNREILTGKAGAAGRLWAWAPNKSAGTTILLNIYPAA